MARGLVVGTGLGVFPEGKIRSKVAEALMEAHKVSPETQAATMGDTDEELDHGVDIDFRPQVQTFTIGGVTYEVKEPVLVQEVQLIELLRATDGDVGTLEVDLVDLIVNPAKLVDKLAQGVSIDKVLAVLGAKIPRFFAIILTPQGTAMKDKDVALVEADLLNSMTLTDQGDVMLGFFTFAESLGKAIGIRAQRVKAEAEAAKKTQKEGSSSAQS